MPNKYHSRLGVIFLDLFLCFVLASGYARAEGRDAGNDAAGVKAALWALKAGNRYEALLKLREVLQRHPHFAEAHFYLGITYSKFGLHDRALRHMRRAIELEPEKGTYRNQVGIILVQRQKKKFLETLKEFFKALEGKHGTDANKVWRYIVAMHQELLEWDEAIRAFERVVASRPRDANAHVALGKVYLNRHRLENAIRELTAAVQFEPERADVYTLQGMAYSRAGRPAEAVQAFRKATVLDPEDQTAFYRLAQNLMKLARWKQARMALRDFNNLQQKRQESERGSRAMGSRFRTPFKAVEEPSGLLQRMTAAKPRFAPLLYSEGYALLNQGKYEQTISSFQKAAALDPLSAGAGSYLGGVYGKRDKLVQALEATQRTIAIYKTAKYYNQIGEIYIALNQKVEARRAFEEAAKLDEGFLSPRLHLGSLAMQDGKLEAALNHLTAAVERNGSHAEARRLLGLTYWENGQYSKGIAQYKAAVRLSPLDERLRMALVEALISTGQISDTEQALKEAIQAIPGSGWAHYKLGEMYRTRRRLHGALEEFLRASELKPVVGLAQLHHEIGEIYQQLVKFDDAIAAYRKALEVNPNYPQAHGTLGDLYLRRNRYDEALAEFSAVLAIDSQSFAAYAQIGQVYLRSGRYAEAVEAAQKALELNPKHRGARYTLATALLRLGKTEEGRNVMQMFQQMQTKDQAREHRQRELVALKKDAFLSLEKGEYDKAIALLRKASELAPPEGLFFKRGFFYLNLGLAFIKAGQHEEAIKYFQKAVEMKFDFPEIHRYLAEEHKHLGQLEQSKEEMAIYARMKGGRSGKNRSAPVPAAEKR